MFREWKNTYVHSRWRALENTLMSIRVWQIPLYTISTYHTTYHIPQEQGITIIGLTNSYYPTLKFKAEISETEITVLDTCVYKGKRFMKESVLDMRMHFKPTETFQCAHFNSCHPPGVRKGFIKGEALRGPAPKKRPMISGSKMRIG